MSITNHEPVAIVPYEKGKTIEYYSDRILFNQKEIFYKDITGFGYSFRSYSHSINFIPTYNSKTVTLSFSVGDDKKPVTLTKTVAMPSGFHSKKQTDLEIIFSEIIKVTDAILFQSVLNTLYSKVRANESLNIAGLIIEQNSVRRKGVFKEKELEGYGRTYIRAGQVIVEDGRGRQFFSTSTGNINAHLLGSLLDALLKE